MLKKYDKYNFNFNTVGACPLLYKTKGRQNTSQVSAHSLFSAGNCHILIGCCGAILPKAQPHRNCGPLTPPPPYPLTENLDPFWLSAQPRPLQRQHATKSALASPYSALHDTWLAHAGNSGPHTSISRTRNQESCRFFEK